MFRFAALLVLITTPTLSLAQTPTERAETFLQLVAAPATTDTAIDQLFAGSGMAEAKPQDIATLKSQTQMAMGLYGTPLGIEKVHEEDLTPSLKRLVYLQKFERYPVALEFYFYKPRDSWIINTMNFKDQIVPLIGSKK